MRERATAKRRRRDAIARFVVLGAIGMAGCGGANSASPPVASHSTEVARTKPRAVSTTNETGRADNDAEGDRSTDADDGQIADFGRRAGVSDTRVIRGLVGGYFVAAVRRDGRRACALMYSLLAEAVPEDYGRPPGPPALRGDTCAVVMSKLFDQDHGHLSRQLADLRMTELRVRGNHGLALLTLRNGQRGYIDIHREYGTWKIMGLSDSEVP